MNERKEEWEQRRMGEGKMEKEERGKEGGKEKERRGNAEKGEKWQNCEFCSPISLCLLAISP